MRRLSTARLATLDLEELPEAIVCRVGRIVGRVAELTPDGLSGARVGELLGHGRMAWLVFQHNGSPVGLRGVSRPGPEPPVIEFAVVDGIDVPERRIAERIPMVAAARLVVPGADGRSVELQTSTADISLMGALVVRPPSGVPPSPFQIELALGGGSTSLSCEAEVVRESPTHLGVKFTAIGEEQLAELTKALAQRRG